MISISGGVDHPLLIFLAQDRALARDIAVIGPNGNAIYDLPLPTSSLNGLNELTLPLLVPTVSRNVTLSSLPTISLSQTSIHNQLPSTFGETENALCSVSRDSIFSSTSVDQHREQRQQTTPRPVDSNTTAQGIIQQLLEMNQMPDLQMNEVMETVPGNISVNSPSTLISDMTQLPRSIPCDPSGTSSQPTDQTLDLYVDVIWFCDNLRIFSLALIVEQKQFQCKRSEPMPFQLSLSRVFRIQVQFERDPIRTRHLINDCFCTLFTCLSDLDPPNHKHIKSIWISTDCSIYVFFTPN